MINTDDENRAWEDCKRKEDSMANKERYPADVVDKATGLPVKILNILPVPADQLIVFMKFGSHLYGTDTMYSDTDYKGVYLPTEQQVLEGNIPKSVSYKTKHTEEEGVRNGPDDIDLQIFSLHYFIELAMKGETVALDMLHAPGNWPEITSDIWDNIQRLRSKFYTKSLKSFVGYARKQAAKYGIKGSRLADIKKVIEFLEQKLSSVPDLAPGSTSKLEPKLADVWDELPTGEHIHIIEGPSNITPPILNMYQIAGKKFGSTVKLSYIIPILQKYYDQYGHRAKLAEENEGIDWKAVSHALRAAMQVSELLSTGTIQYPLRNAALLTEIKQGLRNYKRHVSPLLEIYMNQCDKLSQLSSYPVHCDRGFWLKFLRTVVRSAFGWSKDECECE